MLALAEESRAPRTIVLENVYGALTSHNGDDFNAIAKAFSGAGYRFGALIVDARLFVPQSRPRLFIIGVHPNVPIPEWLPGEPNEQWHPRALIEAHQKLSEKPRSKWIWWCPPLPSERKATFLDLIEQKPTGVAWHTREETAYIISLMSEVNRRKLDRAIEITKASGGRMVRGIYHRTRHGQQRAEVRFDEVSGCLRTPAGGSSRQTIVLVDKGRVRSRLISPREAARLMGLPDSYKLPDNYNQAYQLVCDGVAVPAVRHISHAILEPMLAADAGERLSLDAAE
jgi:DNA (cytosine-5)-methyltransferase 1